MDITIIRGLLIFGCGAAVGAAITNKVLKKKYEVILEEELKQVRAWRKAVRNPDPICTEEEIKGVRAWRKAACTPDPICTEEEINRIDKDGFISDDSIFIPEQSPPDDEEEDQRIYEYESISREYSGSSKRPYVIPLDSFIDEMIGYDKITLGYYEEDDVLVDDNEDMIDDVDYVIGHDALDRFGDGSEDDDVVYIRNERTGADYEVIRHHKSYQTEVLGFVDPPNNRRGY